MIEEDLDPILIQVTVPLPIPMIFSGFTDPVHLKGWMCDEAEVEAKVGGAYIVGWKEPPFTSKGTIEGDTWTWTNEPKMGGKTMKMRFIMKIISATSYTFKFDMSEDGVHWNTSMEGKATKSTKAK